MHFVWCIGELIYTCNSSAWPLLCCATMCANRASSLHPTQAGHFFKVGEPRREGKSMVLSLAQQLAEQIPRFLELLAPIVKEYGSGNNLTLRDAFEK